MEEELKQFILELKNKKYFNLNEEATKTTIILKILTLLSWNIFDDKEIYPEYSVEGQRVDYCLIPNKQSKIFIEAKKTGEELEINKEQLLNYAFHEGVEIAVLTNGLTWWFYLPLNPGSWDKRKFFSIDILQQPETMITSNFIDFLSKANAITGKNVEYAKIQYKENETEAAIEASLPEAWNSLIEATNEKLIDLLNETNEKLCGHSGTNEQIAKFIAINKKVLLLNKTVVKPLVSLKTLLKPVGNGSNGVIDNTLKKPIAVTLNGKAITVKHWKDIIVEVCNFLYAKHKKDFEQKINSLEATKNPYFSKNKDELKIPALIKNSGIYVEVGRSSANGAVGFSEKLMALFGENSKLKITTK